MKLSAETRLLLLIVGTWLTLKSALALAVEPLEPVNHEVAYLRLGRMLVEQGIYGTSFRPPLYPAYLALVFVLGGGTLAVRLGQVILSTLAVLLAHRIARSTVMARAAILAAALFAFDPVLVSFTHLLWSETLFIFLLLAAFAVLIVHSASPCCGNGSQRACC